MPDPFTLCLAALVTVLAAAFAWRSYADPYRGLRLPPGPPRLPVLGSLPFLTLPPWIGFTNLAKKYGDVVFLHMGSLPVLVLNSPRALKRILIDHGSHFVDRNIHMRAFQIASGNNTRSSAVTNGDVWRTSRKLEVQLLLGKHKLPDYEELMLAEVQAMEHNDLPATGAALVPDVGTVITKAFSSIMLRICVGRAFTSTKDGVFVEMCQALDTIFRVVNKGDLADLFPVLQLLPMSSDMKQFSAAIDTMLRITRHFIKQLKGMQDKGQEDEFTARCMLKELLRVWERDHLPEPLVTGVLMNFLAVGIESTSIAALWVAIELANHPDVQTKVRQEIEDMLGDRACTLQDQRSLPYLNAVVWETMRHVRLVRLPLPRYTAETVEIDGMHIPAGTTVFSNMYACHSDPVRYPEPDRFDPTRFLDHSSDPADCNDAEFAPFSVGQRPCSGARLSVMEMQIFLTELLRHYEIRRPTPELIAPACNDNIVVRPLAPVGLIFERLPSPASRRSFSRS